MEHTFLLKAGLWRTEGEFLDGTGKSTAVQGEAQIRHHPDRWLYEGVMRAGDLSAWRPSGNALPGGDELRPRTADSGDIGNGVVGQQGLGWPREAGVPPGEHPLGEQT